MITLVVNSEKTIIERKKMMSRVSSMPFWKLSKCVIKLNEVTAFTIQERPNSRSILITGSQPANTRIKSTTNDTIKLTTWLRVIDDVMQVIAKAAPAISQLPT